MAFKIPIKPEQLSADDLAEVFRIFCKIYNIEYYNTDERFLRKSGLRDLQTPSGLEYRFSALGKFFGRRTGNSVIFSGYKQRNDPIQRRKYENFQKAVEAYFSKRVK